MGVHAILLAAGNFFVLIVCLVGAQSCYFRRSWKWFSLLVLCAVISAACIVAELYPWCEPARPEMQATNHSPLIPL